MQGAHIFQSTLFRGGANIHYYFDVRGLQGYPLCAIVFWHFLKGFSKEIDHLSLVDFFALQNFSGKIWSLEFTASSSKSLEGFRKGLRKGSTRKGIEKQI